MSVEIALPQPGARKAALTDDQEKPEVATAGTEPLTSLPATTVTGGIEAGSTDSPVTADGPAPITNWPLTIMAAIAVVTALYFGRDLFVPLLLAGLITYALDPLHRRLVGWHVPRALSAVLLMAALLATVAVGALALRGQATVFIERLPSITERLRESVRDGRGTLGSTVQPVQQAAAELKRVTDGPAQAEKGVTRVQVEQAPMRLSDFLWRGTLSVFGVLVQATMVLFLVYYLLASGDQYKRKLLTVIGPSLFHKRLTVEILNQITEQIGRFIMARLLISVMVGAATGLSLRWLGVSQPAVWGFAAGVLNNIPYLGPVAACVGIALAGLVQFGTIGMAGVVGGVASAIAAIEGLVLTPWIMGRAGRMNTGIVFVSLMFWGWVWGVWGLLFAVPIMMAVKAVCDHIEGYDFVSEFLRE